MSAREPGSAPEPKPPKRDQSGGFPLGLILAALLLVYAVIFVVLNSDEVKVNFLFFSTRISLVVAIVLVLAIGFAAGYLVHDVRDRRRQHSKPAG
jgi:lipopolysaccharide assembly protein A